MRNIKLTIEYDGTNYYGWQAQKHRITIQETIEKAIEKITREKIKIIGSGRTDGGVHARGQVANFFTNSNIPAEGLKRALTIELPEDIVITKSEEVNLDFHSRFSATKKTYKYVIYNSKTASAISRNYSYHIRNDLDIVEMRGSLKYLIGTHDFKSFMSKRAVVHTTIRTIHNITIEKNGKFIEITIDGNSFLRNMIRIIVGTLVFVGVGKLNKEDIPEIMAGRKRMLAGPTAPAQGLFLEKVYYK